MGLTLESEHQKITTREQDANDPARFEKMGGKISGAGMAEGGREEGGRRLTFLTPQEKKGGEPM